MLFSMRVSLTHELKLCACDKQKMFEVMSRKISLLSNNCHGGQANSRTQKGKLLNAFQAVFYREGWSSRMLRVFI